MIRCSKCGTLNRDNSRFCNECGAPLQPTTIRCPACGTMNPVGNVFCDKCNTRLITAKGVVPPDTAKSESVETPPPSIKGISLPSRQTPDEGDAPEQAELPDWLLELSDETDSSPEATEEAGAGAGLPDWLSGIAPDNATPSSPEPSADESESWFSGLLDEETPSAGEATPLDQAAAEELPDWLSEVAPSSGTSAPATPASQAAPAAEMPDWLSDIAPPSGTPVPAAPASQATPATEMPDWLSDIVAEAEAGTEEPPGELPDWLPSVPEPSTPGQEEATELPDWMAGMATEEPATSEAQPDWLSGIDIEEPASSEDEWGEEEDDEGIAPISADWIEEIAEPAPPTAAKQPEASPRVVEPVGPPQAAPALPDWILTAADGEPEYTPSGPQELPDWVLQQADPDALNYEPSGAVPLPEWILATADESAPVTRSRAPERRIESTATARPAKMPAPEAPSDWATELLAADTGEPEGELETTEEELPDWLSAEPELEAEGEEEELPDWLQGMEEEAPAPAAGEPPASAMPDWLSAEPELEAEGEEEELPDWLQGAEEAPAHVEQEAPVAAEVPDWLSGLDEAAETPQEEMPTFEGEEAPAPVRGDVPDWLASIPDAPATPDDFEEEEEVSELEIAEPPAADAIPDWLSALTPASEEGGGAMPADEDLARAHVPVWLQELRPSGTGPLPPLPEGGSAPLSFSEEELSASEAEGLTRAEIPEWVEKLRPTVTADGEVLPAVLAEEEGPLAGLPGIISPRNGVDIPDDFQSQPFPETPDSILQQAQLWQQLLEQPRSKARAVSQPHARPGWSIVAVRILSAAVLVLAALAGLLLSGERIAQAPLDTVKPGVVELIETIDTLEPGETVILAVEYGPSEALEMQVMVEVLLDHLKERRVNVMAVSSLPEGAGIAHSILQSREITNQISSELAMYLPGTYNGIANFLSTAGEHSPSLLLILSGRADRTRWWLEQNAIQAAPLPIALGVNAATGATMLPYFDMEHVKGWVVGFAETMTYRETRGIPADDRPDGQGFEYGSILDSLMLVHWAAMALIVFGFFYSLAAGKEPES